MLHPKYLREGSRIEIPELSGYVPKGVPIFDVAGVFAGGMGICVHLRQCETGVEYALKGVRPDHLGDHGSVDRFLDELQVWLSASMCNLVAEAIAVLRINETPCVLATWMPKGDLARALPNLDSREKFEALLRLVRGLSWVRNNLGVIHRDLKPANVLLDQRGLAYVADWGLARPVGQAMERVKASLDGSALDRPDRTQAGSFLGTVTYAAPEQIMGASDIDHRADIYALGCMMFEFETGTPPFTGKTVADIARRHLQAQPAKLGGWFKRTALGLEGVIARCLEKKPANRYSTYEELDEVLVGLAGRLDVRLDRCELSTRYERTHLGKGHLKQDVILDRAASGTSANHAILEASDIAPFLEEASNLMALSRYAEAEQLLRPHFHPELIGLSEMWLLMHTLALNYALCLIKTGCPLDAENICRRLEDRTGKPSEFYVNFSLALLNGRKWTEAVEVCKHGLDSFPTDADIQGNLTISLANSGDLDSASDSAIKRIKLRRDIHGIEEAAGILQRQAAAKRDTDLPGAIAVAKVVGDLIEEGIALNPRFYPILLKQIQLRRFAHDESTVLSLCQVMIDADDCPPVYRQSAFAEMVEKLSEGKSFATALDLIQRSGHGESERLLAVKMRTLARHYMIGKENVKGQRIIVPEVREYFLKIASRHNDCNSVIAAEILDWMGDSKRALEVLDQYLSTTPTDWDGVRVSALIHLRMGKHERALHLARSLITVAPWRAESYDWLRYVAQQVKKPDIAGQAKQRGDEVFEKENMLFVDLRAYLDTKCA